MSDRVDLNEFRSAYLVEAEELLAAAASALLAIERAVRQGEPYGRALREVFRAMHTMKGLSAMVGIDPIVAISHSVESALRAVERTGAALTPEAVDTLLAGVRAVEQRVTALAEGRAIAEPTPELLETLEALETAGPAATGAPMAAQPTLDPALRSKLGAEDLTVLNEGLRQGRRAVRADFMPTPERAEAGINITAVRTRAAQVAEVVKVVPLSLPATEKSPGGLVFALLLLTAASNDELAAALQIEPAAIQPLFTELPTAASPGQQEREADLDSDVDLQRQGVVRVEVTRLDDAMERLSALVVTRLRLVHAVAALAEQGVDVREVREILHDNGRQLRDLRASILRVRMVPVAELFERLPLLVRGLGRTTGKQVQLQIDAGHAELDKGVADRIFPALIHLVRNAVDHAIEPPEVRRQLGKPEAGQLGISCFERSNSQLEIIITDDGCGIDRQAVAARAGRPVPGSDAALLELMCLPGLSTRQEATTTSGRGMGMDIVRRIVVNQLRGELIMQTRAGIGTRFVLRVPLTISIVDAFSFECARQRFVVPVSMVEEILEVDPAQLVAGPGRAGGQPTTRMLERRGEAVPFVELARVFALEDGARAAAESAAQGALGAVVTREAQTAPAQKALLVRRNNEPIMFAIDRVLGQQEVVVRPLEDPLVKVPGVAGATDLGDGRPTLVLDLASLGATLVAARAVQASS